MTNAPRRASSNKNADQEPTKAPAEVRIVGTIVLACIGAVFLAVTFRVVRWIAGF